MANRNPIPTATLQKMIKEFRAAYPDRSYEEVKAKFMQLHRLAQASS